MSALRQFAAAALAALLAISLVACSSVLVSLDPESESQFELLATSSFGFPNLPIVVFLALDDGSINHTLALPATPNSLLVSPVSPDAYIGSANGIVHVNAQARTATLLTGSPSGTLQAISPDGRFLAVLDHLSFTLPPPGFIFDLQAGQSRQLSGIGASVFDSRNTLYTAGVGELIVIPQNGPERRIALLANGPGSGQVALHPSESLVAVSSSYANGVSLVSTCDDSVVASATLFSGSLAFLPDGSHLVGSGLFGGLGVAQVTTTSDCPPQATLTPLHFFHTPIMFPVRPIVVPNSTRAFSTGLPDLAFFGVGMYDVPAQVFREVPLGPNHGAWTGVPTPDGASVIFGAGQLYRLDAANGTTQWTSDLPFPPRFLGIVRRR